MGKVPELRKRSCKSKRGGRGGVCVEEGREKGTWVEEERAEDAWLQGERSGTRVEEEEA